MNENPKPMLPGRDILIRNEFRPGDLGELIRLHGVFYSMEQKFDTTFEAYVGEPLARFWLRKNKRERMWLVEKENHLCGSIAIVEKEDRSAQLCWFFLIPELRGRLLGEFLLKQAIEFAKTSGYHLLYLWTEKSLQKAISLYIRCGFELIDEIRSIKWGGERIEQKFFLALK